MKATPHFLSLVVFFVTILAAAQVSVSDNPRLYEKVTLRIETPQTFAENPVTFANYRMDVVFRGPTRTYRVPAYFAGDGDAANTSASSGSVWKAHLLPLESGTYQYEISFRTGNSIAARLSPEVGSPLPPDGWTGTFEVIPTRVEEGYLSNGKLGYVGKSVARFTDGTYFLEVGADSPETFLEYSEFDNTPSDRTYTVHFPDWNPGDPTWQDGKGKGIIGAINYLQRQGMNVHYFVTMNVEGDGREAYPFTDPTDILNYDISKLDQWQIVFDHMMRKGIAIEFVLMETENLNYFELQSGLPPSAFSDARKIYYREMVARFGYLNAVVYLIGEEAPWDRLENQYTAEMIEEAATYIERITPYRDLISIHNGPSDTDAIFGEILELPGETRLTALSVQADYDKASSGHGWILKWLQESQAEGTPWVVRYTEPYSRTAEPNIENWTDNSLWAAFMAGAPGVHYYHGGGQDIRNEDYTINQPFFERMKFARDFFVNNDIPFQNLVNQNERVDNGGYLLTDEDEFFILFAPDGGRTNVSLPGGTYEWSWYNPRTGETIEEASELTTIGQVNTGNPPAETAQSWVAFFRRTAKLGDCTADFQEAEGYVIIEAEHIEQDQWSVENSVPGFSGTGYLEWGKGDFFGTPGNGLISATIEINQPGEYRFDWRTKVGEGNEPTENNDSWLRFPDADLFFARKAGDTIYPIGSGLTPNPEGAGSDGWFKVFSSQTTDWNWVTRTSDFESYEIFVQFDNPGVYTMEISARSSFHFIDRIVLHQNKANFDDLGLAETPCTSDVAVESVEINPALVVLDVGDFTQLTTVFTPSNASNRNVTWTSDDPAVAIVDEGGNVEAIGAGTTLVRVTTEDGGKTATAEIRVNEPDIPVDGVSISPTSLSLEVGQVAQLTATVIPEDATNKQVNWSSDDPSIATVDANGNVDALAPGSTTIRVSTEDGGFTDSVPVEVGPVIVGVEGVSISPTVLSLEVGQVAQLTATVIPEDATNKQVNWSSDDPGIATVDANGIVDALAPGSTTIRVSTEDGGFTDSVSVEVRSNPVPVSGVTVSPTVLMMQTGQTSTLTATVRPTDATNKNVSWTSDNPGIATVDANGVVTSVDIGNTLVRVRTEDGDFTDTASIQVMEPDPETIPVESVQLNPENLILEVGENATLTANVLPENATDKNVYWSSDDEAVATVDGNGQVSAVAVGTTNVRVFTEDGGFSDAAVVQVNEVEIPVESVSIDPDSLDLEVGQMATLIASVSPADASNTSVSWSSDNPDVATVDAQGNVTAIAVGTTTIRVFTEDGGFTAWSTITVNPITIPVTSISLVPGSLTLEVGNSSTLNPVFSPADATNRNLTWSSDDPSVASVDNMGNVTGIAPGATAVRVQTEDGGFTTTASVEVNLSPENILSIALNPRELNMKPGTTAELLVTFEPEEVGSIGLSWSSSDEDVAQVDDEGMVTAISPGVSTIQVGVLGGTVTAEGIVVVSEFDLSIAPNPVLQGETLRFGGLPDGFYSIKLFTLDGKELKAEDIFVQSDLVWPIPNLPSGIYLLTMENQKGSYFARLVIQ